MSTVDVIQLTGTRTLLDPIPDFKNEASLEDRSEIVDSEILRSANLSVISQTLDRISESVIADTRIPQFVTTKPSLKDLEKKDKTLKRKIHSLLSEKVLFLDKALDSYGIIDKITEIDNKKLIQARVYDLHDHSFIDEITFSHEEFSKSDRIKVAEDAIFYWYVGIQKNFFGKESRVSEFRLRRIFSEK